MRTTGRTRRPTLGNGLSAVAIAILVAGFGIPSVESGEAVALDANLDATQVVPVEADASLDVGGDAPVDADADLGVGGPVPVDADADVGAGGPVPVDADADVGVGGPVPVDADADLGVGGPVPVDADADVGVAGPVPVGADADVGVGGPVPVGADADVGVGGPVPVGADADVGVGGTAPPASGATGGTTTGSLTAPGGLAGALLGLVGAASGDQAAIAADDASGGFGSLTGFGMGLPLGAEQVAGDEGDLPLGSFLGIGGGADDGGIAPPSVTGAGAGADGLAALLPALSVAFIASVAAGAALAGSFGVTRGRPVPGAGWLSVAYAAVAIAYLPAVFLGAPAAGTWRDWLGLAVLAIPPWAIARQVRALTRVPTRWLRVVDAMALALVAWALVVGPVAFAGGTTGLAALVPWLLGAVLVIVSWVAVHDMLASGRRSDPRIARARATLLEWIVVAFLVAYLGWVAAPIGSEAFVIAAIGMAGCSLLLALVAVMPRPVSAAFVRFGHRDMVHSIEALVGSRTLAPVLSEVLDGFADGLGVDGLAMLCDGRVVEFGGRCAVRRDRGPSVAEPLVEIAGSTILVAWPTHLAPTLGRRRRERLQIAARMLHAAYERDRLASIERLTIEQASEAANVLASANEALRETNEIKLEFVSLVSHELRTPLTSIVGLARTAHDRWDEIDEERLREFQLIIAEQGERLGHLVNELLLIGRIEEGRLSPDASIVDLAEAADQAIVDAGINDVRIDVDQPRGTTLVCTDRMLLHEVLVNYLSNARKYGEPPIELQFARREDELVIVVGDRGDTIDVGFRPKLFERFTRGATATNRPGTGLGLAIVRELSTALGGDAWYEPRTGGGNCFGAHFEVKWLDDAPDEPSAPRVDRPGRVVHRA